MGRLCVVELEKVAKELTSDQNLHFTFNPLIRKLFYHLPSKWVFHLWNFGHNWLRAIEILWK